MGIILSVFLLLQGASAQTALNRANQRGQAALQEHRYADAIRAFDEALSLAPADNPNLLAGLHYYKAAALGSSGDLLVGIANVKQAIHYAPAERPYRDLLVRLEEEASRIIVTASQISRALSAARSFAAEASIDLWVNYDFDKDSLSPKGREQADTLSQVIKSDSFSAGTFLLIGHTDAQGTDEYNMDLSKRRASRLAEYLTGQLKVPAARIRTEGHGERELKLPGNTVTDNAVNRRVEIRLIP